MPFGAPVKNARPSYFKKTRSSRPEPGHCCAAKHGDSSSPETPASFLKRSCLHEANHASGSACFQPHQPAAYRTRYAWDELPRPPISIGVAKIQFSSEFDATHHSYFVCTALSAKWPFWPFEPNGGSITYMLSTLLSSSIPTSSTIPIHRKMGKS